MTRVLVEIELTQGGEDAPPTSEDARAIVQTALEILYREGRPEYMPDFDWHSFKVTTDA
jgi:hypothetical protein